MVARLLRIAALLVLALGVAWLVAPEPLMESWGGDPDPVAAYVGRRYGVLFLGFAVIFWLARDGDPSPARRAILIGGLVACVLMATMSLGGVVTATIAPVGLLAFTIEAALTAGFAVVLLRTERRSGSRRGGGPEG